MQVNAERAAATLITFSKAERRQSKGLYKLMPSVLKPSIIILSLVMLLVVRNAAGAQQKEMIVRISEIGVDLRYLEEYKAVLKEEAEASVRLEPGVIAIFPMYQKENPTEVRILEIYASQEAYESHLKTPHFLKQNDDLEDGCIVEAR